MWSRELSWTLGPVGSFHPDRRKDTEKLVSTQRPLWPYWESQGSPEESPGGAV